MYTIYHNPRCRKSRAGLEYLKSRTDSVKVVEYLKDPLAVADLKKLMVKLNKKPLEMVRTQEALYKADFKGRKFTDDEWVKIMVDNPKLIKRPIVEKGNKAVWGDPETEIDALFNQSR